MDLKGAARDLVDFHAQAAVLLKLPFLQITPDQAMALVKAGRKLEEYYPMPAVKGPKMALAAFLVVAGSVYLPKISMTIQVAKAVRQQQRQASGRAPQPQPARPRTNVADIATGRDLSPEEAQRLAAAAGFSEVVPTSPAEAGDVAQPGVDVPGVTDRPDGAA